MGGLINTLSNRSARVFLWAGLFIAAAVFIGSVFTHRYENRTAATAEVGYRLSLAGRLSEYGIPEKDAAELISTEITPEYVTAGGRILSAYGYSAESTIGGEYAFSRNFLSEILAAAGVLVCLAAGLGSFGSCFAGIRGMTESLRREEPVTFRGDRDADLLAEAAETLRRKSAHLVEQLNGEKQYLADYLNDFSHQIKTPCTGLMLNNDILSSAPMPFEEQTGYFQRDRKCLERISLLVGASLKLARLDAGAVGYDMQETDLNETVSEAVGQLTGVAKENNAEIINEVERGTAIRCDRLWFCEAVTNLVKNAAEHTHGGQVRISAESDPMTVRLIIEDNGCGISEEELPKVFRRFYSKSKAVNANSVGIGMGVAKRIVEDMNGRLMIDSKPGRGTKIILEFLQTVT